MADIGLGAVGLTSVQTELLTLEKIRDDDEKNADDISSMTGERKNSHLKKHTKNFSFKIPTNLIKSNSDKSSISPITSLGLFEEVDKIKKLIKY